MCRFDDNINTILEGGIEVWIGDEVINDRDITEEDELAGTDDLEHWPGCAFPLKITDKIDEDQLMSMFARYRESFEMEEMEGKNWRKNRDAMTK